MDSRADLTMPEGSEPAGQAITQALLEALPSSAIVIDPQGRVAALNLQAESLLGWAAPALQEQPAHEMLQCRVEKSGDSAGSCPIAGVLSGTSAEPNGRMWVRCRDEGFRPIEYRCVPYPTFKGLGAILAFRDLTHQMEIEKDLRRLASIAEDCPIAIAELNEDANLVHANPAMISLVERFGFSSDARPAILPANIAKLTSECLSHPRVDGIEVSVGQICYEWKLVPVARQKLVRAYGIDLTARRQAEIERIEARAGAEAARRAKSEFLANTSHEIRTPVHVILGTLELLAQSDLKDSQRGYVRTARSCTKSLVAIIEDILDMAALAAGRVKVETACFDFRAFMGETLRPFIQQAGKKGLRVTVTIGHRIPPRVQCDRQRLRQVLHHLIGNAIKFTQRGEIVVEVDRDTIWSRRFGKSRRSEKHARSERGFYLFFTVRDTGIGIPLEKQEMIFDSFSQADGSSSRCYEGAGLGLAIAKELLDLMGAEIGVESEPGKGSRFWFSLPIPDAMAPRAIAARGT